MCKRITKLLWLHFEIQITNYLLRHFRSTLSRSERASCVNNGIRVIEDEYHLISICLLYQHLRFTCVQEIFPDYSFNAFISVLSCNNKYIIINLSKYVYHALDVWKMLKTLLFGYCMLMDLSSVMRKYFVP